MQINFVKSNKIDYHPYLIQSKGRESNFSIFPHLVCCNENGILLWITFNEMIFNIVVFVTFWQLKCISQSLLEMLRCFFLFSSFPTGLYLCLLPRKLLLGWILFAWLSGCQSYGWSSWLYICKSGITIRNVLSMLKCFISSIKKQPSSCLVFLK